MDYEQRINNLIALFENHLHQVCSEWNFPNQLKESMMYALFSGGKRFRPLLALESHYIFSGEINQSVLDFACAIECLHTYSLVHDDLPCMDDDDYRRGQLTVHKKFGEAIAVLTGDALLNIAYELISSAIEKSPNVSVGIKAFKLFSARTGANGLIAGQIKDLAFVADKATYEDISYVFSHKTCDLIVASVECGAVLGGATEESLSLMREFAYDFGFAFQIADDLLDGKNDDACSILGLYDEASAKKLLDEYTQKAINALDKVQADTSLFEYLANKAKNRSN